MTVMMMTMTMIIMTMTVMLVTRREHTEDQQLTMMMMSMMTVMMMTMTAMIEPGENTKKTSSRLVIASVQKSDSGNYTCRLEYALDNHGEDSDGDALTVLKMGKSLPKK